jgi:hypothetical protein
MSRIQDGIESEGGNWNGSCGHTQALRDLRSESRAAICISGMDPGRP